MERFIPSTVNELTAALDWYAEHIAYFAGSSIGDVFCRQMEETKAALVKAIAKEEAAVLAFR